ncbi:MAG: hypothetical protein JW772_00905 [Candidatus Diapherotrites archaeon]|nr:hypothetical protein [Candidatus Diapherotrites archaeon]
MPRRKPAIVSRERRKGADRRKQVRRAKPNIATVSDGHFEKAPSISGGSFPRAKLSNSKIDIGRRNWDKQQVWPKDLERRKYGKVGQHTVIEGPKRIEGLGAGDKATTTRRVWAEGSESEPSVERRKNQRRKGERRKLTALREQISEAHKD